MIRNTICALVVLMGTLGAKADNMFYVGPTWNVSKASLENVGVFTGNRWGVVGGYEYFKPWGFYANIEVEYFKGTLHDGQNNFELKQDVAFGGGRIGPVFPFHKFTFTPYTGFTYHWIRESRKFTAATSNTFDYYLPFIPFGMMIHATINEQWYVGLNYQYQYNIDSYLAISTLKGARWQLDARSDQFVEIEISYKPLEIFSVRFLPFYHYFRLGPSTAATIAGLQLGIPKQSYNTFGAELEFSLHF